MAQIIGRRFDGQSDSNLVVFNISSDIVMSNEAKSNHSNVNEASLHAKLREQRANIEKLKFHKPTVTKQTIGRVEMPSRNKSPIATRNSVNAKLSQPVVPVTVSTVKSSVNPLQQIGVRTKKAADWLQHEKKEVLNMFPVVKFADECLIWCLDGLKEADPGEEP